MPTINTGIDALLTKKMQLGAYTFEKNPAGLSVITEKRAAAAVNTIDGLQFFSWGFFLAGQPIKLKWPYMSPDQFSSLDTIYQADDQTVFRPNTGTDYNVQVMQLTGEYHIDLTGNASNRKNVELNLLIISEVT